MSRRAEQWLTEQEVALLEAIYQLESPPEHEDRRQPMRLEQKVRRAKSRLSRADDEPERSTAQCQSTQTC
jgi:hypothetical protein